MIPPRICITFRRASFWSRPNNSKSRLLEDWAQNTINTEPGSHDTLSEKLENHGNRSKLNAYCTSRAENQAFESPRCFEANGTRPAPETVLENSKSEKNPMDPTGKSVHYFSVNRMKETPGKAHSSRQGLGLRRTRYPGPWAKAAGFPGGGRLKRSGGHDQPDNLQTPA